MPILLENKKAYFDYEILEKTEAGLELLGWEVKSLKNKRGSLAGARAIIRGGEAFLLGLNIQPYQIKNMVSGTTGESRTIKLLLTRKEIRYLGGKLEQKGLTMVPLKLYTLGRKIKVELGLARGKKKYEKKEKIKKRDTEREIRREVKK